MNIDFQNYNTILKEDPGLPHLPKLFDNALMLQYFSEVLTGKFPGSISEVRKCTIELVYYRHARKCDVLYRVGLRYRSGLETDEWIFAQMLPQSFAFKRYERRKQMAFAMPSAAILKKSALGLQSVFFCHDLSMILWIFPADPKIRNLGQVSDRTFMEHIVQTNLGYFDLPMNGGKSMSPWQCKKIHLDRIKYMPAKRCVLHYDIELENQKGKNFNLKFFSKTYNDSLSRYHYERLKLAYQELTVQSGAVNIPKPILYLEGYNTFWQEEWQGHPLLDVLDLYDWEELFPEIAQMMANFHKCQFTGLNFAPDLNDIMETALQDGAQLINFFPDNSIPINSILNRLKAKTPVLQTQDIPAVPIHGACRIEQMLAQGDRLAIIDFDALALGDPLADVAEFMVSLQYLEITQGISSLRLANAAELFLNSYSAQVPWACNRRRIAWYAQAFWVGKMLGTIKRLDLKALKRLKDSGENLIDRWTQFIH